MHSQLMSTLTVLFFHARAITEIYTLSLHDALPISQTPFQDREARATASGYPGRGGAPALRLGRGTRLRVAFALPIRRSEEHTSELQSHSDLVCRLLLEKKNW